MKSVIVALTIVVASAVSWAAGTASAHPHGYDAILLCPHGLAEDSAAHVKLVTFERAPEGLEIVYRCKSKGY